MKTTWSDLSEAEPGLWLTIITFILAVIAVARVLEWGIAPYVLP